MEDFILFRRVVPEYKLNKVTQQIEVIGEIDLQEQIESNMVEPLEVIFDKFMGVDTTAKKELQNFNSRVDKLDLALRSVYELESLRNEYKLPKEYSHQQVVDYVKMQGDELAKKVDYIKSNLFVENKEDKKEIKKDEKSTIKQESE